MTTGSLATVSDRREAPPEAFAPPSRTVSTATACLIVAGRTVRKVIRTPQLIVIGTIQATVFLLVLRYVFGGAVDLGLTVRPGEVPYVDFLIPGYIVGSTLFTSAGAAVGVADDIERGFSDRLRSLPVTDMALLAGHSLADTALLAWNLGIATIVAFIVGFQIHGNPLFALSAYGLCVVYGFAFTWLFICIGTLARDTQAAQNLSMSVFPVTAVSGAWVPVDTMPGWLQPIAANQPVTVMTNAVRSLVLGDPSLAGLTHGAGYWVLASLVWCLALMAVFAPLAIVRYGRRS